jgi:L-glyceraldehyde 3-phosphate reductase
MSNDYMISEINHRRLNILTNEWVLRKKAVTSAIIGASNINQIEDCLKSLDNPNFSEEELNKIDKISLK